MTIQAGLEGEGEGVPERNTYLLGPANPKFSNKGITGPPLEKRTRSDGSQHYAVRDSDDGYDAMRDDWTEGGNDWRHSRPYPRRGNQRRRY